MQDGYGDNDSFQDEEEMMEPGIVMGRGEF